MAPLFRSRAGRLAALVLVAGLVVVSAATASHQGHRAAPNPSVGSREHRALLDLYALDSRLGQTRARVSHLTAEATRLRRQRTALRAQLHVARATLAGAQRQLALQLRTLYEHGAVDPIAVMLGATNIDEGLQQLDALRRIAAVNQRIVGETRAAARKLFRARHALAADIRSLSTSLAAARAAEESLASTAASKEAYVASLRASGADTTPLLATAGSAAKKSQTVGTSSTPPLTGGTKMTVSATCYILKGTTASGLPVGPGIVAVDPTVIPLGTRLYIPGYGKGIAADIGGGIKGKIIDLWYSTYAACAQWGRRTVTITVY